jgi:hypothetical protein
MKQTNKHVYGLTSLILGRMANDDIQCIIYDKTVYSINV